MDKPLYYITNIDGTAASAPVRRIPYLFTSQELAQRYRDYIYHPGAWSGGQVHKEGSVVDEWNQDLADHLRAIYD